MNKAKQSSVIVKIGSHLTGPGIIIGSHMDTLDSEHEYKPGADDDASGVATLLETARVILSSHQQFKKPLYLVWYAGEEEGKLGSQSVVQDFRRRNIPVAAVMQLDMTGFASKNGMGIGLTDDYTDTGLTAYLADLVTNYVKLPVGAVTCGYACSDHVSWYQNGTPVAYPFETMDDVGNPHVDTRNDTVEKLSVSHIADFVKLSVAFAIELAEPV
jgi:leucyl aminopeptidase